MNKPIVITSREAVKYEEVTEEWGYEKILDLFPDNDGSLVNPLVRRCQEYEAQIDQLRTELAEYREAVATIMTDQEKTRVVRAMCRAYLELNTIRAHSGVPYTSGGYPSSVDAEYFSSVVDDLNDAVCLMTGIGAHCHPVLYGTGWRNVDAP